MKFSQREIAMAHTKAKGSTKNGRDSQAQRLGVKLFGGQLVKSGNVVVRQRGTKMIPGLGTALGVDHTIYATISGRVLFGERKIKRYSGQRVRRTTVNIQP